MLELWEKKATIVKRRRAASDSHLALRHIRGSLRQSLLEVGRANKAGHSVVIVADFVC